MSNNIKRVFGLDVIRALAIVSVLLCHLSFPFYPFFKGRAEMIYNFGVWVGGYYGVELFFVLSGFLIGGIFIKTIVDQSNGSRSGGSEIRNFWMRRWFRTLPNYYLFLLVNLLVGLYLGNDMSGIPYWKYFLFLQKIIPTIASPFYGVSWSLAVEEWFYLLMPLLFILGSFFISKKPGAFLFAVLTLFLIAAIQKIVYCYQVNLASLDHAEAFHFSTFFRLDSIAFGVLLARFWHNPSIKEKLVSFRYILAAIGSGLLMLSLVFAFAFLAKSQQNPIHYLLFGPICSIAIALCFPYMIELRYQKPGILYKSVVFLSLISYSLYLCHIPIMRLIEHWTAGSRWFSETAAGAVTKFSLMIGSALLVSHILYRCFELPILALRDRSNRVISNKQ